MEETGVKRKLKQIAYGIRKRYVAKSLAQLLLQRKRFLCIAQLPYFKHGYLRESN